MSESTDGGGVVLDVRFDQGDGTDGIERILSSPVADGRSKIVLTPGFVSGFAAGDLVEYDARTQALRLVEHGGNVGVQFFHPGLDDRVLGHVEEQVKSVGGTVDGRLHRLLVLTFPASLRVKNIQNFLQAYESSFGVEWEFANLFAEDGKPLSWWKDYV